MGGFGSGRPADYGRVTVEDCCSLDVNRLQRAGCLEPGWCGGWRWTFGGGETASIGLHATEGHLGLAYRVRRGDGEWTDVSEIVPLVRVPCGFGASRTYLQCLCGIGGTGCGRRVAKLYLHGIRFRCRRCHELAYFSQSESPCDRALRRANKIRRRLGGEPGMGRPFPDRPPGMWLRTYWRLWERTHEAEMVALRGAIAGTIDRLEPRLSTLSSGGRSSGAHGGTPANRANRGG